MISKAKIKHIKALQVKKYRKEEQCFVVEGVKSVVEVLRSDFEVVWVAATADFEKDFGAHIKAGIELTEASANELIQAGSFQSNDGALAIVRMKPNVPIEFTAPEWALVLDDIRDPGNLGTIIRTADWYGVNHIIASSETADLYNPKVISATMGSFCRVKIFYTDLSTYLDKIEQPVFGTFLDGIDVHQVSFPEGGLIVIGNESNGISTTVGQRVTTKITIPRYGKAESLNAAMATGIVLDVLRSKK